MKLVRLTSTENRAMFDNTLNDPISLPANAQVALSNVALASKPRSLVVDADNGVVTFNQGTIASPNDVLESSFTLEAGLYNAGNEAAFMEGMEADLNDAQSTDEWEAALDAEGSLMMNTQWAVVENKGGANVPGAGKKLVDDDKVVIGFRKACTNNSGKTSATDPIVPATRDFVSSNVTVAATPTTSYYNDLKRTAGSGDEASYMVGHTPMGWGPGGFALVLDTITDAGGGAAADVQGVFIGLTRINHAANGTAPTRAECKFGIHSSFLGQSYKIYKDNVVTDGIESVAAGEAVLIRRNKGTYEAWIADTDSTAAGLPEFDKINGELEYTYRDNAVSPLYPVIIFYGLAADTQVSAMSYSPDPYLFMSRNKGVESIFPCLWDRFDIHGEDKLNLEIILSQDVAEYLGFLSGGLGDFRFPSGPTGSTRLVSRNNFGWKAARAFDVTGRSESFYVQLLSNGCEGYDGLKRGRENILAVIPKSDTSNILLYDVSNPLFLEIGNAFPITLRNISARVLTEDGGELATDGLSVMTLLYK